MIKYVIYPGSVVLQDGTTATFTAGELATAYGIDGGDYLTVNSYLDVPAGVTYFEYIHLKPRADGVYINIKDTAQDDGQTITYGEDFDGTKKYTQETDPLNIDKDVDFRHN